MDALDRGRGQETKGARPGVGGKRNSFDELYLAFVLYKEVAKDHAERWSPNLKDKWAAAKCSSLEEAEADISARPADQCNTLLGQELPPIEGQDHAVPARTPQTRLG